MVHQQFIEPPTAEASQLQASGRFLDTSLITHIYASDQSLELAAAVPCSTLRRYVLDYPLDQIWPRSALGTSVPLPLVDLSASGLDSTESWTERRLRHNACILNEVFCGLERKCYDALEWYRSHITTTSSSVAVALSLPKVRIAWIKPGTGTEVLPKICNVDDGFVDNEDWTRCEIKFTDHAVQNAWSHTMTAHTAFMLFVYDRRYDDHTVIMAYTLPKEEEDRESSGSASLGDPTSLQTQAIALRVSNLYHRGYIRDRERLNARYSYRHVADLLYDFGRCPDRYVMKAARLDSFLMDEFGLMAMASMPLFKTQVLLKPEEHAWCLNWDMTFTKATVNTIYDEFASLIRPYISFPLAPQQLRCCLVFIMFLYQVAYRPASSTSQSAEKFLIGALGGPPGTGKTATIAQAMVLSRERSVVLRTLQLLYTYNVLPFASDEAVADAANAVLMLRMVYAAPTNQAVDTGCLAIDRAIKAASRNLLAQQKIAQALRICDYGKVEDKPLILPLHGRVDGAKVALEELQAERNALNAQRATHNENLRMRKIEKDERAARDLLEQQSLTPVEKIARQLRQDGGEALIDSKYPILELQEYEDIQSQSDSIKVDIEVLRMYIADPVGCPLAGNNKRYAQLAARADSYVDALQNSPSVICCLTAGYVNPYHNKEVEGEEIVRITACTGTVTVLDEAGQCDSAHLMVLAKEARSLVLCGDANQLGAVLKGPVHGNIDLRESLMARLETKTLWLTNCWRLHIAMTRFLSTRVYSSVGLYHPTGQNVLRASPLHGLELFAPVLILNVAGSVSHKPAGSTSRQNEAEILAVNAYLRYFSEASRRCGLSPIDAALISPYSAQGDVLLAIAEQFNDDTAFSSMTAGVIEKIQGATTDLCICSTTIAPTVSSTSASTEFLTLNRFVVAISRATTHLVLVCNLDALRDGLNRSPNPLLASFLTSFPILTIPADPSSLRTALDGLSSRVAPAPFNDCYDLLACNAPEVYVNKFRNLGEPEDTDELMSSVDAAVIRLKSLSRTT